MDTDNKKYAAEALDVRAGSAPTFQDRRPNFRDEAGNLFLVRCYHCSPEHGRENYAPVVATGTCAWCGWPNRRRYG